MNQYPLSLAAQEWQVRLTKFVGIWPGKVTSRTKHLFRINWPAWLGNNTSSNQTDNPHCLLCQADTGLEIQEDYKHALHSCPNSQKIIKKITDNLFPNITPTNNFNISDILLTNSTYTDPLYDTPEGKDFINLVWDIYQTEIITNHTVQKRPTPIKAIKKIVSEAKDIVKNLPNSKMTKFVKSCPPIVTLLQLR